MLFQQIHIQNEEIKKQRILVTCLMATGEFASEQTIQWCVCFLS